MLPPQPDDAPGPPADVAVQAAGTALAPVPHDVQGVTRSSLRITDQAGAIVASTGSDDGRSLAAWPEVAAVLGGAPVASGMHRPEPARSVPGGISRVAELRVLSYPSWIYTNRNQVEWLWARQLGGRRCC